MKQRVTKEFIIWGGTLVLLALAIHPDLLSDPLERFNLMQERGNYFHPLFYSLIVYGVILLLRIFVSLLKKLFFSQSNSLS